MKGIFFAILSMIITTLLIPMLIVTSCELNAPIRDKPRQETVESDLALKVLNHETGEIMELYLEDYLLNVVAAEMPAAFELEALKAQAVAARTYAVWKLNSYPDKNNPHHPGADLCTSHTHCQEWLSKEVLRERHGRLWMYQYWPKIEKAVEETRGIIMTYDMKPIEPLYHSTSGGQTENSEDVFASALPYLRSVSSPYEERSPVLVDQLSINISQFIDTLNQKQAELGLKADSLGSQISILERTNGGSVRRIKIGNGEFTGREIREIFGLRSANFEFEIRDGEICFITRGYGHGVGMSQWGANGMAERGHSYEEILKHYYFGVTLSKLQSYIQ